jgi:hypothetical protein
VGIAHLPALVGGAHPTAGATLLYTSYAGGGIQKPYAWKFSISLKSPV